MLTAGRMDEVIQTDKDKQKRYPSRSVNSTPDGATELQKQRDILKRLYERERTLDKDIGNLQNDITILDRELAGTTQELTEIDKIIVAAVKKDIQEFNRLLKIYRDRLPTEDDYDRRLKVSHDFILIISIGHNSLTEFYLTNAEPFKRILPYISRPQNIEGWHQTDLNTLYILYSGLEMAVLQDGKSAVDFLLTRFNLDPNFMLPPRYSFSYRDDPSFRNIPKPLISLLCTSSVLNAKPSAREEMLRFLLNPKYQVNVDQSWEASGISGFTALSQELNGDQTNYKIVELLLAHRADPYHIITFKRDPNSTKANKYQDVNTNILQMLEMNPENAEAVVFIKYWLAHGKRSSGEEYSSPEHSSGERTPEYAGSSADGSPTDPSAILQHSPPRLPASNGSPSSSSSGSNDEAADNDAPGGSPISEEKIRANPDKALILAMKRHRPLDEQIKIYHSGVNFRQFYLQKLKCNALQFAMGFPPGRPLAEYMLTHGAHVDTPNQDGETMLHIFARSKNHHLQSAIIEVEIELCLRHHADINAKDSKGNTPLFAAAGAGNNEIAAFLLDKGADIFHRNGEGLTVVEYAEKYCQNPQQKAAVIAILNAHKSKLTSLRQQPSAAYPCYPPAPAAYPCYPPVAYSSSPLSNATYDATSSQRFYSPVPAASRMPVSGSVAAQSVVPPAPVVQRASPSQSGAMYMPATIASSAPLPIPPRQASENLASPPAEEKKKSSGLKGFMRKLVPV